MLFTTVKFLAFSLGLASSIAAAPNPSTSASNALDVKPIFESGFFNDTGVSKNDEPASRKLVARANCYGMGQFNIPDATALGNWLQANGGNSYVPARSWVSFTWGTAKICVSNAYFFDNTHVSNWEAGWGGLTVRDACCGGNSPGTCTGGTETGHGDSGLSVRITLKSVSQDCIV